MKHSAEVMAMTAMLLVLAAAVAAQPGPHPTFLRDLAETKNWSLGQPAGIRVVPDGSAVLFLRSGPRDPAMALFELDVATKESRQLLTPADVLKGAEETMTAAERARRERLRLQARGFVAFDLSPDGRLVLLPLSGKLFLYDRVAKTSRILYAGDAPVADPRFSPDGKQVAYVKANDVWVADVATGKEKRVTTGGTDDVTHGSAEFVAQEEMERFDGFWWSPDGKSIAFEEADSRGVERFTIADPAHPERAPDFFHYPRPGKENVKARLGLAPVGGGKPVWVAWDTAAFPYLARVVWSKSAPLAVLVQSRDQRTQQLLSVDAKTGKTKTLLEQKDVAWLNLDGELPKFLPDGSLLVSSEESGRRVVEQHATGKPARVVVPAEFGFEKLVGVSKDGATLLGAGASTPLSIGLFRCELATVTCEWITPKGEAAEHKAVASEDLGLVVDTVVTAKALPRTSVRRGEGSLVVEVPSVAETPPFEAPLSFEEVGDKRMQAVVVRPRGFVPGTKLPVILWLYGGPHFNIVRSDQRFYLTHQWLADHGFVVVSLDGRGTPRRGRDWERAIKNDFGTIPLEDQVEGLRALGAKHPEMDLARVGVYGWSFGGYLAALATLKRPDVFKAGVAGAPVVAWEDYDTHYTERYLDLPAANAKGYETSSLLTWAPKLERPLLVIHGTGDDNVYFFHSLKLADALFKAGKPFELLPLTGTHMVADPNVRIRLWERIAGFFERTLR